MKDGCGGERAVLVPSLPEKPPVWADGMLEVGARVEAPVKKFASGCPDGFNFIFPKDTTPKRGTLRDVVFAVRKPSLFA